MLSARPSGPRGPCGSLSWLMLLGVGMVVGRGADGFVAVSDRVAGGAGNAVVGQGVFGLLASPCADDESTAPQDSQVLGGQRLGDPESVDQFMDAARPVTELQHDGQPMRRTERPQQRAGGVDSTIGCRGRRGRGHHVDILENVHALIRARPPKPRSNAVGRSACQRTRAGSPVGAAGLCASAAGAERAPRRRAPRAAMPVAIRNTT